MDGSVGGLPAVPPVGLTHREVKASCKNLQLPFGLDNSRINKPSTTCTGPRWTKCIWLYTVACRLVGVGTLVLEWLFRASLCVVLDLLRWGLGGLFTSAVSTVPGAAPPAARRAAARAADMTHARRDFFHECRMQFHRHCIVPRIHVVRIATFVEAVEIHSVELHAKLLRARAAVPRRT